MYPPDPKVSTVTWPVISGYPVLSLIYMVSRRRATSHGPHDVLNTTILEVTPWNHVSRHCGHPLEIPLFLDIPISPAILLSSPSWCVHAKHHDIPCPAIVATSAHTMSSAGQEESTWCVHIPCISTCTDITYHAIVEDVAIMACTMASTPSPCAGRVPAHTP